MEKINKEQMLEDILQVSSGQRELVENLGDALMHIALAGHFNEKDEWEEPDWKNDVLRSVAQARELIQKLYTAGLDYCNGDLAIEIRSKAAQDQVDELYQE